MIKKDANNYKEIYNSKKLTFEGWLWELFHIRVGATIPPYKLGKYKLKEARRLFNPTAPKKKDEKSYGSKNYLKGALIGHYIAYAIKEQKVHEAVNIIVSDVRFKDIIEISENDEELISYEELDYDLINDPSHIFDCILDYECLQNEESNKKNFFNTGIGTYQYHEECRRCPVQWLHNIISYIEKKDELWIKGEDIVKNLYQEIKDFEGGKEIDILRLFETIRTTINTISAIKSVESAYVQWFYTKCCRSEYIFKKKAAKLSANDMLDVVMNYVPHPTYISLGEEYRILYNSYEILKREIKKNTEIEELLSKVETDKMIVCTFYLTNMSNSINETKKEKIIKKLEEEAKDAIRLCQSEHNKLSIYIDLFYLLAYFGYNTEDIETNISNIFSDNNCELQELRLKYLYYRIISAQFTIEKKYIFYRNIINIIFKRKNYAKSIAEIYDGCYLNEMEEFSKIIEHKYKNEEYIENWIYEMCNLLHLFEFTSKHKSNGIKLNEDLNFVHMEYCNDNKSIFGFGVHR